MIPVRIEAKPEDDGFRSKPADPTILPMPGVKIRPERENTHAKAPTDELGPRDIINALKYHSVLFVTLGSMLAGALGAAAWFLVPAKFTTYAMVYVAQKEPVILDTKAGGERSSDFEITLKTQASIIKSSPIITGALHDPKIAGLSMVREQPNPVEFFEEEIKPEISANSQIIKVTLTGKNPSEIAQFVNAVVDFYMEKVKSDNQYKQRNYDQLMKSKRDLEQMRDAAQKFLESQIGSGPLETMSARQKERLFEFQSLRREQQTVRMQLTMAREVLKLAETKLAETDTEPVTIPDLDLKLESDRGIQIQKRSMERTELAMADYLRRKTNPNDVIYLEMTRNLAQERSRLEKLKAEYKAREEKIIRAEMRIERTKTVENARAQVLGLEIASRTNMARLQEPEFKDIDVETGAKAMNAEQRKAFDDYERYRQQVNQIETALMAQKVNLDAQERIMFYDRAQPPSKREMKKQIAITGVAGLFGFGLIGGLISVAEIRRKRVYSSKDPLFHPARLPLLGVIPEHGVPHTADFNRPTDIAGRAFIEAVDKLRTAIGRQMARRKMQVLLVTSASPDEGKSILAWHLALSSARADRRTLFIDGNLKNPGLHNHFDIASHPGLSELLKGDKNVQQVVQRTALENLWCIAAGVCDDKSRQALDKEGLRRLLEKARQDFDVVVIDSCSVQEAVDPLYVAQRTDGVIVSVRTFQSGVAAVEKAIERLTMAGGQLLGAVLTDATGAAYEM